MRISRIQLSDHLLPAACAASQADGSLSLPFGIADTVYTGTDSSSASGRIANCIGVCVGAITAARSARPSAVCGHCLISRALCAWLDWARPTSGHPGAFPCGGSPAAFPNFGRLMEAAALPSPRFSRGSTVLRPPPTPCSASLLRFRGSPLYASLPVGVASAGPNRVSPHPQGGYPADALSLRAAALYTVPAGRNHSRCIPVRSRLRLQGTGSPREKIQLSRRDRWWI